MMAVELDDATAQKLSIAECCVPKASAGITTINKYGMYGYFQISTRKTMPNWQNWGGKESEIGHAHWDRQLEVARVGWAQMATACAKYGWAGDASQIYCGWNVGPGTVQWCVNNPDKPLAANPKVLALCRVQAWHGTPQMTGATALQRCRDYFNKGKTTTWIPPQANASSGKIDPDEISPGADSQGGNAVRGNVGHWGGIIRLYLIGNSLNPQTLKWTTEYASNTVSHLFYMPGDVGMNGTDSFISRSGDVGMLDSSQEVPMIPTVQLGGYEAVFIPLTMS